MSIQNEPINNENAPDDEKIAGIIDQTRADIAQGHVGNISDVLAQRLADAEIQVSPEEFEKLAAQLS